MYGKRFDGKGQQRKTKNEKEMFCELERRMSEVGGRLSCALQCFSEGRNCRVFVSTFIALRLRLFVFGLWARGTSLQPRNAQKQHKSSINVSSLTLASVFFGAPWPTEDGWAGRRKALLESIFRTNRGWGVGRELEEEEKEGIGGWSVNTERRELATIEFSC